jgi:hypothetical protein
MPRCCSSSRCGRCPELREVQRQNALQIVKNAFDEHGTAKGALQPIMGSHYARRRLATVGEEHMSCSMGDAAAQEEALMLLRVELGLGMLH